MIGFERARSAFVGDLTRTSHMLAVSAVIMGATFMPLVGGLPRGYELDEIRSVIFHDRDRADETVAAPTPRREIRAQRSPARVQRVARADQSAELTTLALVPEADAATLDGASDDEALEEDEQAVALETLEPDNTALDETVTPAA